MIRRAAFYYMTAVHLAPHIALVQWPFEGLNGTKAAIYDSV